MKRWLPGLWLGVALAGNPSPQSCPAETLETIRQLGSNELSSREQAFRTLLSRMAADDALVPDIQKAAKADKDPEVRARCADLLFRHSLEKAMKAEGLAPLLCERVRKEACPGYCVLIGRIEPLGQPPPSPYFAFTLFPASLREWDMDKAKLLEVLLPFDKDGVFCYKIPVGIYKIHGIGGTGDDCWDFRIGDVVRAEGPFLLLPPFRYAPKPRQGEKQ